MTTKVARLDATGYVQGHLKSTAYKNRSQTLIVRQDNICRNITSDVTEHEKLSYVVWTPSALEAVGNELREMTLALYMSQVLIDSRCKTFFSL